MSKKLSSPSPRISRKGLSILRAVLLKVLVRVLGPVRSMLTLKVVLEVWGRIAVRLDCRTLQWLHPPYPAFLMADPAFFFFYAFVVHPWVCCFCLLEERAYPRRQRSNPFYYDHGVCFFLLLLHASSVLQPSTHTSTSPPTSNRYLTVLPFFIYTD